MDGSVVGLVLYQTGDGDFEPHECEIFGFMIDRKHQGKGIGKTAIRLLAKEIKALNQFTDIELSCDPKNIVAKKIYEDCGFVARFVKVNGDLVYMV